MANQVLLPQIEVGGFYRLYVGEKSTLIYVISLPDPNRPRKDPQLVEYVYWKEHYEAPPEARNRRLVKSARVEELGLVLKDELGFDSDKHLEACGALMPDKKSYLQYLKR